MLTAVYHMLRNGVDIKDLGADHFDRCDRARTAKRPAFGLNTAQETTFLRGLGACS
jgi:hypothetical protein